LTPDRLRRCARWSLAVVPLALACSSDPRPAVVAGVRAVVVGEEAVPEVRLYENHSSALIAWKRADVSGRILVHLDGHIDYDWLPDETVARIAAASAEELPDLESHPYDMDGDVYSKFGIWNFIYPAARLGMVRELIWVVPDGTLHDALSVSQLVLHQLLGRLQMVPVREAATLRTDGRVLRGTLLGLPVTICELSDLPDLPEPVLLDVDLDYFTTRSAITQIVTRAPWTTPARVVEALRKQGVRTDLATISFSTIGGYLPPASRWIGRALRDDLQMTGDLDEPRLCEIDPARSLATFEEWVARDPQESSAWFLVYRSLRALGRTEEASRARTEAVRLEPVLEHEELFEGDRLWINREYEAALAYYEGYLQRMPTTPFLPYVLRRKGGCLLRLGRVNEGLQTYWKVLELAPDHADSHKEIALALREHGNIDLALEEMRLARRILPARADYAMAMGTTSLLAGRLEEGIANLSDAVVLRPCWTEARRNLAMALLEAGRFEEAARHVHAGLAVQPGTPPLRQMASELQRRGIDMTRVENVSAE